MTPDLPSAEPDIASPEHEMLIMQAILKNCADLGIAPDQAKSMAVRSVLNRRRARNAR